MIIQILFSAILVLMSIGGIFGLIIGVCSTFQTNKKNNQIEEINNILPGYNCGACGKAGCYGLAEAIAKKDADPKLCRPIKQVQLDELKKYLNKE